MVSHAIPQMVSITGSIRAGKAVAQAAADTVKRCHLELGGKAPVIVLDDADLSRRPRTSPWPDTSTPARTARPPRACWPARGVQEDLSAALVEQAGDVKLSKDEQNDAEDFYIPPINNANQLAHVSGLVDRAPDARQVMVGGEQVGDEGYFYAPTVVGGLQPADELSAPRSSARSSPCSRSPTRPRRCAGPTAPSTASRPACGQRPRRALRMSGRSTSAACGSTATSRWSPRCRTAGSSSPGYGKDLSAYSLEEYTRVKHVMSSIEG